MKFSHIAVLVVVLALTHGGESASVVKRDAPTQLDTIIKYAQDLSSLLTKTTKDLVERVKSHELTGQAQTYLEEKRTQLQPVNEQVQEYLQPLTSTIEEQLKPLTESVQAQLKPFVDSVHPQLEDIWKTLMDATKVITSELQQ